MSTTNDHQGPVSAWQTELVMLGHGTPLWDLESTRSHGGVRPGDVGYLESGAFVRLFNLANDSKPSPILEDGPPIETFPLGDVAETTGHLPVHVIHTPSITQVDSSDFTDHDGGSITLTVTGERGALLLVKGDLVHQDIAQYATLQRHISRHCATWLSCAQHQKPTVHLEDLIIVTGCDIARDTAAAVYSDSRGVLQDLTFRSSGGSADDSLSTLWGSWYSGYVLDTDPTIHLRVSSAVDPQTANALGSESGYCTFLRGYRICRRNLDMAEFSGSESNVSGRETKSQDPLKPMLDYIFEFAPQVEYALVHDDDLVTLLRLSDYVPRNIATLLKETRPLVDLDNSGVARFALQEFEGPSPLPSRPASLASSPSLQRTRASTTSFSPAGGPSTGREERDKPALTLPVSTPATVAGEFTSTPASASLAAVTSKFIKGVRPPPTPTPSGANSDKKRRVTNISLAHLPSWLRGRPDDSPAIAVAPKSPDLSLSELIRALTPPAVASPHHARAFAHVFATKDVTVPFATLNQIITSLCNPDTPASTQIPGWDIMATHWRRASSPSSQTSHSTSDRLFHFSLIASPYAWSSDIWEPRCNALQAMINAPMGALGVESDLLAVLSSWIEGAFGRLVTLDVIPLDERLSRERCVDTISNLLTSTLSDARIASRLVSSDINALTKSLLTMVGYALDLDPNSGYSPAISQQPVTSASHPVSRPTSTHRRRISSNFISPMTSQVSLKVPLDCIIPVYVGILASQSTIVSYADLDTTVPILCRALAYYSAPIPMPTTSADTQTHSSSPYYDQLISALSGLLNGHYATNIRLLIKKALMPSISNKKDAAQAIQTSTGAYRIIRVLIRHSLRERLTTQAGSDKYGEVIDDTDYDSISQAFEVSQFGRVSQEALKAWILADCHGLSCEAVLEEAVHIINDVLNVYDSSDVHGMDMDEAIALGETLVEVVKYVKAFRPPGSPIFTIPLTDPKTAPTPFLRNLTSLLSREAEITPIKPPLTEVLLSIAENLADVDTTKIPEIMYKQRSLTPTNSDWIENWRLLLTTPALHSSARPLTRSAIFHHMESLYDILSDLPEYRIPLGSLVYNYIEAQAGGREAFVDAAPWRILGEEIVLRSSEIDHGPITYDDEGEVVVDHIHPDVDTIIEFLAGLSSSSHHRGSVRTPVVASPTSLTTHDPLTTPLWRHSDTPRPQSSLDSVAHSVTQSGVPTPQVTSPPSQSEAFTTQGSVSFSAQSLAVSATAALITTFMELVYTSRSLGEHNLVVAVRIFRILLNISLNAPEPHARLCALQFLLRMRADREHRLHYAGHVADAYTRSLAAQIGRGDIPPVNDPLPTGGEDERSSRTMPDGEPSRESLKYRGRGMKPSKVEPPSRSRSRAPRLPSQAPSHNSRPAIWRLSDEPYFKTSITQTFSERLTSYDPDGPGRKVVLPLSDWLMAVIEILDEERDWEILSYVLCHLPSQLANKHLMCGPKCRVEIVRLFDAFCTTLIQQTFASSVVWPSHAHPRDAAGLAYNAMIIMTSYRVCLDPNRQHLLVETFYQGLSGPPAAQQCCLHGLTLCAYEMPASIPRKLVDILDRLSQIMSSPQMPVNIMNFLHVVGSKPELYTNFTQDHYKKVFAVCVRYLSDFNRHSVTPGQSWAIAQHVRIMSFATLYVWFLAVDLPDRPAHVSDITRGLLAANEGNDKVDEPTEVCFDWLARYAYGSADPRPAGSPLDDIIMRKGTKRTTVNASELARPTKAWLMGDTAVITMKALPKAGWVEIVARRACGLTKILCRLDNVPMIGPGDVEPDMLSLPGILMMDRSEHDVPPEVQGNATSGADEESMPTPPRPDPISGYVWSGTAPSQRRKDVTIDPAFLAIQLSPYPRAQHSARGRLITNDSALNRFLRNIDRMPVIDTHKVGVMYVAPGQQDEESILANTYGSPAYTRFLSHLGRLIDLRGQKDVYTGELEPGIDGDYAYAWWDDIGQIVYHVATMMPTIAEDAPDASERRRRKKMHIGNDYVRIVWNDSGIPYDFDTLHTQVQFVNIVIEPHSAGTIGAFSSDGHEHEYFRVSIQRVPGMPPFTPLGDFKLVSATSLPTFVRHVSLHADWFANAYKSTEKDTNQEEIITNWRERLRAIRRFADVVRKDNAEEAQRLEGDPEIPEGIFKEQAARDFSTMY